MVWYNKYDAEQVLITSCCRHHSQAICREANGKEAACEEVNNKDTRCEEEEKEEEQENKVVTINTSKLFQFFFHHYNVEKNTIPQETTHSWYSTHTHTDGKCNAGTTILLETE